MDNVNLADLHYKRQLPLDWAALTELGIELNNLRDEPFSGTDLAEIIPPKEARVAIVMVASIVANRHNRKIPIILPTKEDVQKINPWLISVEKFLGRLSPFWMKTFGEHLERMGSEGVAEKANALMQFADFFRKFPAMRHQFLSEIAVLYTVIAKHGSRPESRIESLLQSLMHGDTVEFNSAKFPLLFALRKQFQFDIDQDLCIAAAELLEGIHCFLLEKGIDNIPDPPPATGFDPFELGSWFRLAAEVLYSQRLEKVKARLPHLLTLVMRVLPEDGVAFSDSCYEFAETITSLGQQGMPPHEIVRRVFG